MTAAKILNARAAATPSFLRSDQPAKGIDFVTRRAVLTSESPAPGDVLITTEGSRHLLSVVPHPHRLSLGDLDAALQIARRWALANNAAVWRSSDGVFTKVPLN